MKFLAIILPLLFCSSLAYPYYYVKQLPGPYRPPSQTLGEKKFEFNGNLSYWQTTGYFDQLGDATELEQNSFNETDLDLSLVYGLARKFQVSLGTKYRFISTEVDQGVAQAPLSLSGSGFENFSGAIKYSFPQTGEWDFAIEAAYYLPLYSNEESVSTSSQIISIGDAQSRFLLMGHFSLRRTRHIVLAGGLGLNFYSGDQSQELPYNFEITYFEKDYALGLGVDGIYSLETDKYTDDPTAKPITGLQATNRYNSINRSFVSPYVAGNYALDEDYKVTAKLSSPYVGKSTDKGLQVELGFSMGFNNPLSDGIDYSEKFKSYELEAYITKVSPRGRFVKIDRGVVDDIEKGMRFDIYKKSPIEENILIASGRVFQVSTKESIIKILKIYQQMPIQVGFLARGFTEF